MDTKAAFEEWWMEPKQDEIRLSIHKSLGYSVWEASRASIEIELKGAYLDANKGKIVLSYTSTIKEIALHGIRIKVKTE